MKIDDDFYIEKDGDNFVLIRLVDGYKYITKAGEKTKIAVKNKKKYYSGALYQALQTYLVLQVNKSKSVAEIIDQVYFVLNLLETAKVKIKKDFSIVVRKE